MKIHALQEVAIVGGGLAGLTLARILQVHGVQPVVYEKLALREAGARLGALALQPESSQRALRAAKLTSVVNAMLRVEGQDLRICDKAGSTLWEEKIPTYARNRAEVDLAVLRDTLIDSLYPAVMRWDHTLTSLEPDPSGGFVLHFAHGESAHADLVLGADGRDSVVRAAVSPEVPVPTGVEAIGLTVSEVASKQPALASQVGPGTLLALQDGKGLRVQRHGDLLSIDVAIPILEAGEPGENATSFLHAPPTAWRAMLVSHFESWAPWLVDLLRSSDDALTAHSLVMLPDPRWAPRADVSLLGGAAHAVPLLHGGQTNLALIDAVDLAQALLVSDDVAAGLRVYEAALFQRAAEATTQAVGYMDMCMAADGARRLADWMGQRAGVNGWARRD